MEHSNLMNSNNCFALCKNCNNITVYKFSKCHKCQTNIDRKKYNLCSNMIKYKYLINALMTFEIDIIDDCYSMISIRDENDNSDAPELYQIWKRNNKYIFAHFEKNSHNIIHKEIIDPKIFIPTIQQYKNHKIELLYGPYNIYV